MKDCLFFKLFIIGNLIFLILGITGAYFYECVSLLTGTILIVIGLIVEIILFILLIKKIIKGY